MDIQPFIPVVLWGALVAIIGVIFDRLLDIHWAFLSAFGTLFLLVWFYRAEIANWGGKWWLLTFFLLVGSGIGVSAGLIAIKGLKPTPQEGAIPVVSKPSLVFVFGTPLGDNKSPKWLMLLKHFGPDTAHNCDIHFVDNDRKNLEHEWLVKHPQSPFLPPGMFDESQKHIHIGEAGPESPIGNFEWVPVNPDSQHYSVSISCRDGVFDEKWEITRVDGVLRCKITIEHGVQWAKKNPTLETGIFRCGDGEFIGTSLATELPKVARPPVHPGWKPNHRFDVPAAIIDPNGNVQVVAAVRAPDGSTITDFGCWNILTKHFGD
jgi:hypothetical protein